MKRKLFLLVCLLPVIQLMGEVKISGCVTDYKTGEPIIGASILQIGTIYGTITDFDGNFEITVPSNDTQLSFSYMGYVTLIVLAQDASSVRLKEGISRKPRYYGKAHPKQSTKKSRKTARPRRDPDRL